MSDNNKVRGDSVHSVSSVSSKKSPVKQMTPQKAVKQPEVSSNDTPARSSQPTTTKEFSSDDSEFMEIDVVGEVELETETDQDIVLPGVTSSGEKVHPSFANQRTPTKSVRRRSSSPTSEELADLPVEKIFSSFPCNVIPETLLRLTKTPVDGEHLEVRRFPNGRLRIIVTDQFKKFSPYSNMTHRPCIVCTRTMKTGEMHLNFPADLDRRRIWANLLGFKYKDILRSKIGPVSFSVAGGPICTEHFSEECFRNHNFNKAAIEAFGVPVAISPDVKTTPSKKRVPWVCTICDFNSCSVVELQQHLIEHAEEIQKEKTPVVEVPKAGFMCPFCRKCTYGYRTIGGFKRHLLLAPINHCHLRRIYEFAKINCRASELEPTDSWENWTRRNVYVAYHGCEPPIDEIILTPSPTKSILNSEEKSKKAEQDLIRRQKAVRSLSFVGKEGGTSVNDLNVMQRAAVLQMRKMNKSPSPTAEGEKNKGKEKEQGEKNTVEQVEEEKEEEEKEEEEVQTGVTTRGGSGRRKQKQDNVSPKKSSSTQSFVTLPVKKSLASTKGTSCPVSPEKTKQVIKREVIEEEDVDNEEEDEEEDEPEKKKIDEAAFAKMIEKRTRAVKRLISAKLPTQPKKPRKAFSMHKTTSSSSESTIDTKSGESTHDDGSEDSRPLKSVLARSFAEGKRPPMAKYRSPYQKEEYEEFETSSFLAGFANETKLSSSPYPEKQMPIVRLAAGAGTVRPSVLGRRPMILAARAAAANKMLARKATGETQETVVTESGEESRKPEEEKDVEEKEEGRERGEITVTEKPKTLAEVLAEQMSGDESGEVTKQSTTDLDTVVNEVMADQPIFAGGVQKVTQLKQTIKMSKHCMRQLEAARARSLLFGKGNEERFDVIVTSDGPQLITEKDPEWKLRQNQSI